MSDTPKLNVPIGTVHLPTVDPASTLHVTPTPQQGGPVSLDVQSALSKLTDSVNQLLSDVADLKKRVSAVETQSAGTAKDMVAVKLVMPGVDQAITDLKTQLTSFHAEYSNHMHTTGFDFESFAFLNDTPGNNKPNFFVPYVWLNSNPELSQMDKEKSVQKYLNVMSKPKPSPFD